MIRIAMEVMPAVRKIRNATNQAGTPGWDASRAKADEFGSFSVGVWFKFGSIESCFSKTIYFSLIGMAC